MVLGAGVLPTDLAGKFTVRADVVVNSKPIGRTNEIKPYQITVVRVINDKAKKQ
ncbi:hypothetical protein [Paludibacterium denitrificans]|uniref:hypothetical protein n=1 Tax=Paludibacterium denitrificans TaxID=2675226 RepID=UPI001E3E52EA|nr:hypothetical protein [Paludibacterium denitrificans]